MKFKLYENFDTTILYFATETQFIPPFRPSEEGIHFMSDLEDLERIAPELRDKRYIYKIEVKLNMKPLYIDDDILLWSGPNLAELFLKKLDNEKYEHAFEEQEDISPELTHIEILEEDREILEHISKMKSDQDSFNKIWSFIRKKGFNCISYIIWEGDRVNDRAIILNTNMLFNYDSARLVSFVER